MDAFTRTLHPGTLPNIGRVFVKVEYSADGRLSITGVEGPLSNGDARGSCGQIRLDAAELQPAAGWDAAMIDALRLAWDRWHLNDMRAGCAHQRARWNTAAPLEVVSYKLTTDAYRLRDHARAKAADAALHGRPLELTDTERALALLEEWYRPRYTLPDADSPLSGCYTVEKRETKAAGWVYPSEHPQGFLTRPCEECGYRYGSAWLREEVPADVLTWLRGLPETTVTPAWV